MKRFSKLFAVLLALILVISTVPAVFAAGTQPGKQASVSFTVNNIYGIDGEFTFSNSSIISGDVTYTSNTTMNGSVQNNLAFFYGAQEADITITVAFKVSSSAKDGDKCDVKFRYETSDVNGDMSDWNTVTKTVVVEVPEDPTEPSKPAPEDPTTPSTPSTPSIPSTPSKPATVDYTELNKQIAAAKELAADGYTADSWAAMQAALKAAEAALKSKDQKVVDDAAAALADAIKNLKKLDYTALQDAIQKTETFLNSDALGGKGGALIEALNSAKGLLNNAEDQNAIDAAAAALVAALNALEEALKSQETQPAPVEPSGDYCNISIHYVWPILFFISLAVNLAFVVLVVYYVRRKKKETDDTPLVDYEIGDDE